MRAGTFSGAWLALVPRAEESCMGSVKKISQWRKSYPSKPKGPSRVNFAPEVPSAPSKREAEGISRFQPGGYSEPEKLRRIGASKYLPKLE